jgi:hypothetical protein
VASPKVTYLHDRIIHKVKYSILVNDVSLTAIHKLGWAHNDIRWLNIICVKDEWILIDCEYVSKFGTKLPNLKVKDPQPQVSSSDLYQLGRLLDDFVDLDSAIDVALIQILAVISTVLLAFTI